MHKPLTTAETAPIQPVPVKCGFYAYGINFDPRTHTEFVYRVIGIEETQADGAKVFRGLHQTHSAPLDQVTKEAFFAAADGLIKAASA